MDTEYFFDSSDYEYRHCSINSIIIKSVCFLRIFVKFNWENRSIFQRIFSTEKEIKWCKTVFILMNDEYKMLQNDVRFVSLVALYFLCQKTPYQKPSDEAGKFEWTNCLDQLIFVLFSWFLIFFFVVRTIRCSVHCIPLH